MDDVLYTIDLYQNRYKTALKKKVQLMKLRYEKCMAQRVFKEPLQKINERAILLDTLVKTLTNSTRLKINDCRKEFVEVATKIDSLSPMKTMARGYSIVEKDGKIVKKVNDVQKDDELSIRLSDGQITTKVL